jgi:hypothetical protein
LTDLPVSPLVTASPESLAELFERDPLTLTDGDIERIVTELRSAREKWLIVEKKGKKVAASGTLSLADLGL